MSEPTKIEDHVTKLKNELGEVRHLAVHADKEASDNNAVLRGQVGILNAVRADQMAHGVRLDRLERKVDDGLIEMRGGFSMLSKGQERITELLEARDDPEDN